MQALQNHDTVINVIDAVVVGTEKFSEVAGMKRERDGTELQRPEMRGHQVKTGM